MWLPHRQPLHMLPGGALTDTDVTPYSCVRLWHRRHRTTEQLGSPVYIYSCIVKTHQTHLCMYSSPVKTHQTDLCMYSSPVKTHQTYLCMYSSPVKTHQTHLSSTAHLSYLTRHTCVCTTHLSYLTRHTCVCTAHLSYLTRHTRVCTTHLSKLTIHTCVAVYVQLTCLTFLVSYYDKPWELSNYSKLDPHIVIYVSPDQAFSFSPLFIIDRHCPTQECQMMLFLDLLVLWYGSRQHYY